MAGEMPMRCSRVGCGRDARTFTLYRVNEVGVPGVFMCAAHAAQARRRPTVPADPREGVHDG